MALNKHRGEIQAVIEGKTYKLCLTLGAMAEIETALGAVDIATLGERLQKIRFSDLLAIVGALLRGGGHEIEDRDVGRFQVDPESAAGWITDAFAAAGWAGENPPPPKAKPGRSPGGAGSKSASAG